MNKEFFRYTSIMWDAGEPVPKSPGSQVWEHLFEVLSGEIWKEGPSKQMRMSRQKRKVVSMFRTLKEWSLASRSIFLSLSPPDPPIHPRPACGSHGEAAASHSAPDTFKNSANKCRSEKHSAHGDQFLFPSPVATQREIKSQQQVIAAGGSS